MDSIIIILIVATPFIFYSYTCFPDVKVWKTSFFTYESTYFNSIYVFAWTFLQKFIFLMLMLIWFNTCNHWWNKAILVPIGMLFYQIIILLNDEIKFKDNGQLDKYFLFPLIVAICFIIILIRKKLLEKVKILDLKEEVDNEIIRIQKQLDNE